MPTPPTRALDPCTLNATWLRYRAGRADADRDALALHYTPFAQGCLRRVLTFCYIPPREREDAQQDALLGLLDAIGRYDPARGMRFENFAGVVIRGAVLRGHEARSGRTPHDARQLRLYRATHDRLAAALGRTPTADELAAAHPCRRSTARAALLAFHAFEIALDAPVPAGDDEGDVVRIADVLPDPAEGADARLERAQQLAALRRALYALPDYQAEIVLLHFAAGHSLARIGRLLDLPAAAVRQTYHAALHSLRETLQP